MSEITKKLIFKDKILPNLEVLLQFSLSLTQNGRDATKLTREAMEEAYRSWDESMPEEGFKKWLHKILVKRFFNGFQRHSQTHAPINDDNVDGSLIKNNQLIPSVTSNTREQSRLTGESGENKDANYLEAIAGLPAVCRSAMILSYIEGFSNKEIADSVGVQPRAVESLLNRGRKFIREELFAYLMGDDDFITVADQAEASG